MSDLLICVGVGPIDGCGKILTNEEKQYYECCCETCMRKWDDAVSDWRAGEANDYFDKVFADQIANAPTYH